MHTLGNVLDRHFLFGFPIYSEANNGKPSSANDFANDVLLIKRASRNQVFKPHLGCSLYSERSDYTKNAHLLQLLLVHGGDLLKNELKWRLVVPPSPPTTKRHYSITFTLLLSLSLSLCWSPIPQFCFSTVFFIG